MFLPVLLVRDFGAWSWIVFAVPNVIGAGAMGWIVRDRDHSIALVEAHRPMMAAFSWVTIAFHLQFASWMIQQMNPSLWAWAVLVGGFGIVYLLPRGATLAAGVVALLVSVTLFIYSENNGWLGWPGRETVTPDLIWLGLACLFGFALCPYLDLTFHRARQETSPSGGRIAFGLGFGVFFLAMIVFTLFYSGLVVGPFQASTATRMIALHMAVQSAFTIAVHAKECPQGLRGSLWAGAALLLALVIGFGGRQFNYNNMSAGEIGYRLFMSTYSVLFPAYAWICMAPTWNRPAPPNARAVRTWLIAIVVASGMYWMAFIERKPVWIVPALVVLVGARYVASRRERQLSS